MLARSPDSLSEMYLPRLVACGYEVDILYSRVVERFDSFDDVDYRAAGADSNIFGGKVEVVFHRSLSCVAFGCFDIGGCSG